MPRLSAAQLEERRKGIGSSDIAAIAGLSPYRDAWDVFNEKIGLNATADSVDEDGANDETIDEEEDPERAEAQEIGHELEPWMAGWYARTQRVELMEGGMVWHRLEPWAFATLDRKVLGRSRVVEIKIVGARASFEWDPSTDDGVPHYVRCQGVWAAECLGCDIVDVAACLGGTRRRIFTFERDPDLARMLLDVGRRFWNEHIVPAVPPPMADSGAALEYLAKKYPKDERPFDEASPEAHELALKRIRAAQDLTVAKSDVARLDNELRAIIGDSAGLIGDGWKASWRVGKGGARRYRFTVKGVRE